MGLGEYPVCEEEKAVRSSSLEGPCTQLRGPELTQNKPQIQRASRQTQSEPGQMEGGEQGGWIPQS